MNSDEISISSHALDLFYNQYEKIHGKWPFDCKGMIEKLFEKAYEVKRPDVISKEIKYGQKARYFLAGDWYFVTNETVKNIFTILNRKLGAHKRRWPKKMKRCGRR